MDLFKTITTCSTILLLLTACGNDGRKTSINDRSAGGRGNGTTSSGALTKAAVDKDKNCDGDFLNLEKLTKELKKAQINDDKTAKTYLSKLYTSDISLLNEGSSYASQEVISDVNLQALYFFKDNRHSLLYNVAPVDKLVKSTPELSVESQENCKSVTINGHKFDITKHSDTQLIVENDKINVQQVYSLDGNILRITSFSELNNISVCNKTYDFTERRELKLVIQSSAFGENQQFSDSSRISANFAAQLIHSGAGTDELTFDQTETSKPTRRSEEVTAPDYAVKYAFENVIRDTLSKEIKCP